jgi:PAS domain S-box-containing protein
MNPLDAPSNQGPKPLPVAANPLPNRFAEIRLLIVEEPTVAARLMEALSEPGVRFISRRVNTEASLIRELGAFAPDVVLAGPRLPMGGGPHVIELIRSTNPAVPVIKISSRGGAEEIAASVRAGARDCIFSEDLSRLAPAVLAALRRQPERRVRGTAEALLRASEIRYRRLFEAAKDGILILDADTGQILDANPFMTELLGYSRDEYLGKYLWEIGAFADLVASQAAFGELQKNRYIRYDDLPLRTKSGCLVDVEFVSNVYPADGHDSIQCNIRNITQRKATARTLFQAQKLAAIGTLTGGIAHNINNLLTIIVSNLELLRSQTALDKEGEEYAREAFEAALRGSGLVRHMLAFAREQPLRPQRIDINDLISNVAQTLQSLLGEEVGISLHLSEDVSWPVLTDAAQLEASIINLAVNAQEAMPNGGTLSISTFNRHLETGTLLADPAAMPGDYVEIVVNDTGVGMAETVLQHIFEPFFSTKGLADKPGTGLGLSTVFGFIKQSGGHIGIESEVGIGTTFRLLFPRLHQAERVDDAPAPQKLVGGSETVLVVEDNAALRRVVVRQVERLGYKVHQCEDAAAALAVLADTPIDLLFSDIVIAGEVNGLKLAWTALARWPSLKVLLSTGFGDAASRGDAHDLPVLEKPYRAIALGRALREALDGEGPIED